MARRGQLRGYWKPARAAAEALAATAVARADGPLRPLLAALPQEEAAKEEKEGGYVTLNTSLMQSKTILSDQLTFIFVVDSSTSVILTSYFYFRGQCIRRVFRDAGAQGHDPVGGDVVMCTEYSARARRRFARAHRWRGLVARAREQAKGMLILLNPALTTCQTKSTDLVKMLFKL